jgi:hypothetical protein
MLFSSTNYFTTWSIHDTKGARYVLNIVEDEFDFVLALCKSHVLFV